MNRDEQNEFLSVEYSEALRYMDNAKDTLGKAGRQNDRYYKDKKYVATACGVAYIGVLRALDAWFALKGVPEPPKKKHKTIDFYRYNVAQIDNKMLDSLATAYNVLHLEGYYRDEKRIKVIAEGFEAAYEIIEKIKPETLIEVRETRAQVIKRKLNNLMVSLAVAFG